MPGPGKRLPFLLVLVAVIAVSWLARAMQHQRIHLPGHESWVTTEADTLYHLRRADRAMREGFPVAETDAYLNFPQGSAIPWPPYYTFVTWAAAAPGSPADDEARRDWIERRVASLPMLFGILTSVLAAFGGRMLAGNVGGLIAGGYHALSMASIAYSKSGNGDHHAWITMLTGAVLLLLTAALARKTLTPRRGLLYGSAMGVLTGVALGSWVASLLYLVPVQLVLGWKLLVHSRRPDPGVPALGLAFHLAAVVVLLPAVLSSPWSRSDPWMVVNLTWFHAAWLGLGAAVFAPLLFIRTARALRNYPWYAAGALAVLAVCLLIGDAPPAAGVREGFAWMGRGEDFMSSVWESRGLVGQDAAFNPASVLGWGVFALPLAWVAAAWLAFRRSRHALLPWTVIVPLLTVQAFRQVRFGDALALPMAVLLAWGCMEVFRWREIRRGLPKAITRAAWVPWAAAALGVALAHWDSATYTWRLLRTDEPGTPEHPAAVTTREMCEWIRANTAPGDWSVLASWNWGHAVEWAADRPSVATNFGTYVGEESFRVPSRFFMAEDPERADATLAARRSRYVLLTSWLPGTVRQMVRHAVPERERRYLDPSPTDDAKLRFESFRTIGARLLYDGAVLGPDGETVRPLDFLRLAHVSPRRDPRPNPRGAPAPAGWIWERVPGAVLEAHGAAGDDLHVTLRIRYPAARYEMEWSGKAACGADGIARLRVPYATDAPNGDGTVVQASWQLGGETGTPAIPASAVTQGAVVPLFP